MNPHLANPAGRLWALLVYSLTRGPGSAPILSVWAEYLGVAPEYSAEFLSGLALIRRLPQELRTCVLRSGATPTQMDALLAGLPQAESALDLVARLDSPIRELRDRYDAETLSALKSTSAWLNGSATNRGHLPARSVSELARRAHALTNLLANDHGIDSETRDMLLDHSAAVLAATRIFAVAGPDAVLDELDRTIGYLALRPDVLAQIRSVPALSHGLRELVTSLRTFESVTPRDEGSDRWGGLSMLIGHETA